MEYLIVWAMPLLFGVIIFFVYKQYTGKNLAKKTEKMSENIIGLTLHGFAKNIHGFRGTYHGFDVNIYPTNTPGVGYMQGKLFQVWISIAPMDGQLKGLGGFFGKYMVVGERPGYAMIGFALRYNSGTDQSAELLILMNQLVDDLQSKGVMAYVA